MKNEENFSMSQEEREKIKEDLEKKGYKPFKPDYKRISYNEDVVSKIQKLNRKTPEEIETLKQQLTKQLSKSYFYQIKINEDLVLSDLEAFIYEICLENYFYLCLNKPRNKYKLLYKKPPKENNPQPEYNDKYMLSTNYIETAVNLILQYTDEIKEVKGIEIKIESSDIPTSKDSTSTKTTKTEIIEQRINRTEINLLPMAQYKLDADKSLYDDIRCFIDHNFDKLKYKGQENIKSGIVVYEDRNHKTEVIYEGNFEIIGNYNFNAQTEKIKDTLEEFLITQYLNNQNPTLFINLKDLAKEINVNTSDLRKRIIYIMESLQTIRLSYTTKGKLKNVYTDFASLRIISSSEYHSDTDILEVNFDNKYAFNLSTHNFFQLPKKYRKISDNKYQYAYPLAKYIYELCRQKKYKITFKSLYEQIKKIPRIEDLKKQRASITQKIYEPLIKHFNILNEQEDFTIAFENENFLLSDTTRKNIDFDKMLKTNIIITWKNKPNYETIEKKNKKYQDKMKKERERLYTNATKRKTLK